MLGKECSAIAVKLVIRCVRRITLNLREAEMENAFVLTKPRSTMRGAELSTEENDGHNCVITAHPTEPRSMDRGSHSLR